MGGFGFKILNMIISALEKSFERKAQSITRSIDIQIKECDALTVSLNSSASLCRKIEDMSAHKASRMEDRMKNTREYKEKLLKIFR